jgi:hypothetical protein
MNNRIPLLSLIAAILAGISLPAQESNMQTIEPADHGRALVNPQMGWTMHFYSNIITNYGSKLKPSDTLDDFPGLSCVYLRVPWSFIEPQEGKFNFSLLDTPAQRWIDKGKQIALRISSTESWMRWATPEWVHDAGAKGYNFTVGKGVDENGPYWEPDYKDPVFLEKLDNFLAAMAERYDGNPNVAFIDIGSFGVWGEGHTWASSKLPFDYEIRKIHVDLYCKHFKKTLLAISDDFAGPSEPGRHFPITDYALSKGVTLRDDSICVQPPPNSWFHAEMAQEFWPKLPVILEHEHYGPSKRRNAWGDGSLLLQAIEEYHASYMSIHWWPRILLNENREIIDKINRRMGYRIQLKETTFPKQIHLSEPFTVTSTWANAGVAPCYPGGFIAFTIKDDKGGIVAVFCDESFNVRDLKVGPPGEAPAKTVSSTFAVALKTYGFAPNTQPGTYDLYVSVGMRDGTPVIALPYEDDDGHRRFKLGTVQLLPSNQ